jgi:hypothetical protein
MRERALITEHAPAFISYPIGRDKLRIRAEQGPILFVRGEAGETEQRRRRAGGSRGEYRYADSPVPSSARQTFEGIDLAGSIAYSTTQVITDSRLKTTRSIRQKGK